MNGNCSFTSFPREDVIKSNPILGSEAISQIFRVIDEQSQPTFDADFNVISYYNWTGTPGALSPPVNNEGNGEPKGCTGLVGTHQRGGTSYEG